jgi:hypothetical protein
MNLNWRRQKQYYEMTPLDCVTPKNTSSRRIILNLLNAIVFDIIELQRWEHLLDSFVTLSQLWACFFGRRTVDLLFACGCSQICITVQGNLLNLFLGIINMPTDISSVRDVSYCSIWLDNNTGPISRNINDNGKKLNHVSFLLNKNS